MQVPSELKPAASGAVGDAIALAIVGFNRGGWVTDATASKTARDAADIAIVKVLAPTCAEMLQQQADAGSKMVELRKASAWDWSWPYPSVWMFAPNLCSTNEVASNCLQFTGSGRPGRGWRGITLCFAGQCRSSIEIEAIEVQQKIVYDSNKKPAPDRAVEGRTRRCLVCRKQFFSA